MRGSRNFRQGGGPWQYDKKSSDSVVCLFFAFFLVLDLVYRSQMVNFKEKHHFLRFRRGSKFFQVGPTLSRGERGSNCLFPIETKITCDFPGGGGVRTPCPPPSGSALGCDLFSFPVRKMIDATASCTCACFPETSWYVFSQALQ